MGLKDTTMNKLLIYIYLDMESACFSIPAHYMQKIHWNIQHWVTAGAYFSGWLSKFVMKVSQKLVKSGKFFIHHGNTSIRKI